MVDNKSVQPYGVTEFSEKDIDHIEKVIEDCEINLVDSVVLEDEDSSKLVSDTSVRSCKTCFLPPREELVELFGNLIRDYNNHHSGWNFDLEFIESIQLGHYHEGDFYDWHIDSYINPVFQNDNPYNRKVSVTVFLNDPEEYEGGEFDLEMRGPKTEARTDNVERYDTFKLPKGSMLVFPSYVWHRVRPVTSGVRKSLVLWIQGPPFK